MFGKKKERPEFEAWQTAPGETPALEAMLPPNHTPHQGSLVGGTAKGNHQLLKENILLIAVGMTGKAVIQHGLSALAREAQVDLSNIRLLVLTTSDSYDLPLDDKHIFRIKLLGNGQPDLESMGKKLQTWAGGFGSPRVYFCVDLSEDISRFLPYLGGCLASEKEHFVSFPNRSVLISLPQVQPDKKLLPLEMLARLRELIRFSQPNIEHHMLVPELYQSVPQLFDDLFVVDQQAEPALGEFLFCLLHPSGTSIHQQLNNLRVKAQDSNWARVASFSIKTNKKEAGRLKAWAAWQAVELILFGCNEWDGFFSRKAQPAVLENITHHFPDHLPFGWFFKENQDFANLPPTQIITDGFHISFAAWLRYAINLSLVEKGLSVTRQSMQYLLGRLDSIRKKLVAITSDQGKPEARLLWDATVKIIAVCDAINKSITFWDDQFKEPVQAAIKQKAENEFRSLARPDGKLINEFIQEDEKTLRTKFQANYSAMGENVHRQQVATMRWNISGNNELTLKLEKQDFSAEPQENWLAVLHQKAKGLTAGFAINQAGEMTSSDRSYAVNSLREYRQGPFLRSSNSNNDFIQKWSVVFSPPAFIKDMGELVFGDDYILENTRQEVSWDIPRFTAMGIHYGIPIRNLDLYRDAINSYYEGNNENRNIHFCGEEIWARDLEIKFKERQFYSAQIVHTLWSKRIVSLYLRAFICGYIKKLIWQTGTGDNLAWGIIALGPFLPVQLSNRHDWSEFWNAYENFTINYPSNVRSLVQKELRGENGNNPFSRQNRSNYWNALVNGVNEKWGDEAFENFRTGMFAELLPHKGESEKIRFLINMLESEMRKDSKLELFSKSQVKYD